MFDLHSKAKQKAFYQAIGTGVIAIGAANIPGISIKVTVPVLVVFCLFFYRWYRTK